MMIPAIGALIAVVIILPSAPAMARCQWTRSTFYLAGDTHTNTAICDSRGGSYNFSSRGLIEFTSFSVAQHPRNGKLAPRDGLGLEFRPATGFQGGDLFTIKICGTLRNVPGCSTINFRVTVR
ncbi:MAG: hypothetical protein ACRCXM_14215 [Beijerinckiaceae bacterium]